jgi:hypothetical protein
LLDESESSSSTSSKEEKSDSDGAAPVHLGREALVTAFRKKATPITQSAPVGKFSGEDEELLSFSSWKEPIAIRPTPTPEPAARPSSVDTHSDNSEETAEVSSTKSKKKPSRTLILSKKRRKKAAVEPAASIKGKLPTSAVRRSPQLVEPEPVPAVSKKLGSPRAGAEQLGMFFSVFHFFSRSSF